jgi:hypothetical protein
VPPGAPESPRRRTIVLAFAILAIGVAICAVGYLFAIGFLFTIGEVVIIVAIAVALYTAISRVRGIRDRD